MNMRIGHGYDAHRFAPLEQDREGRLLILGGVTIDSGLSLLAHSDGDLVIHALCDALLGAIAAGDIGRHFPDSSAEFENIDSGLLLQKTCALLEEGGWRVVNADLTIVAQAPKLAPYVSAMCERLAGLMGIGPGQINIKATTTEGMGFVGRKEGIASYAVVLLCQ